MTGMASYRQQQPQPPLQQPSQGGVVFSPTDQIAQRRADLLIGKRSFGDFQAYHQQQILLQQQQQPQQQQQNPLLILQKQRRQHQQLSFLQQQYLMRSVKQRTNGFASSSPISPLSSSIDLCSPTSNNNSLSSPSARFGVPIYQQLRQQQQQSVSVLNNNNNNNNHQFLHHNQFNPSNNCFIPNLPNTNNNLINPIQTPNSGFSSLGYSSFGPNLVQPKPESQPAVGYSTVVSNPVVPKAQPDVEDHKILNTLHELEKHLLNDDNDEENDAVSVITNSEWSETFQNLMSPSDNPNPSPSPSPNTNHASSSTSGSTNTNTIPNNNNNMISPSPTSSTSSCCSTSTPTALPPPPETLSAKQLISEAATAISEGKNEQVNELLTRLGRISNAKGNSEQRLAFYMGNALRARACPNEIPPPVRELYSEDQMQAMYSLYDISPCFKFGLLAANLVMLEAITFALQEGIKVHVIDFDIGHGAQYINLLRALAERRSQIMAAGAGSFELKVTVVETEVDNRGVMESVKDGLVKLAEKVGITLKFAGLTRKITELTRESLGCEDGEAIVVNFAFKLHRVPDESVSMDNLRDELLRRVKGLNPRAVTLVEQEMSGNTASFMNRVNECCGYFGALLDSFDSTLPKDHLDRVRVEEGLGRKMANSVACEGRERVERAEVFGKWRARMGMAGFELKPLSQSVAESMRARFNSTRGGNPGFTVKEESGGVGFGWMGRTLTVASAWR